MSLQARVIRSILDSSRPANGSPIQIADRAKHAEWLEALTIRLGKLGVPAMPMRHKDEIRVDLMISVDADLPYFEDGYEMLDDFSEPCTLLFVDGILYLEHRYSQTPRVAICHEDQIQWVADAIHARLAKQVARRQKTAKVQELKYRFVAARVHEMVEKYQFWFRLERFRTMAWLAVTTHYNIDIVAEMPYEAVIPCMEKVEALVADVYQRKTRARRKYTVQWDTRSGRRWWTEEQPPANWGKIPGIKSLGKDPRYQVP